MCSTRGALIVESLTRRGVAFTCRASNGDCSREHVVDLAKLGVSGGQKPEVTETLALDQDCPKRTQFLHRLDAEIAKRGVIDVLRKGVKHGPGKGEWGGQFFPCRFENSRSNRNR